mgnify:CR=1 FL=1
MRPSVLLAWAGLIPVMIANGVARESLYGPRVGDLAAHQISTGIGIVLLFAYVWFVLPRLRVRSPGEAWSIGLVWVALTIAFEFLFGRFVAGHSWGHLIRDHNVFAGRIWALFLLATLTMPRLIYRLRDPS